MQGCGKDNLRIVIDSTDTLMCILKIYILKKNYIYLLLKSNFQYIKVLKIIFFTLVLIY